MIEINLVPEQLRKKHRARTLVEGGFRIPKEVIIGVVGGFSFLMIFVVIILQVLIFAKIGQRATHEGELKKIASDKANADGVLNKLRGLQAKVRDIEMVTGGERIFWAQKLNGISDNLPRGVWLSRITLEEDILFIQGSAVAKDRNEMIHVHRFAANLKNSDDFMESLSSMDLGMIKSRKINVTSVADFTISAKVHEDMK